MATSFAPPVQRLLEYFLNRATAEEILAYTLTEEEADYARDLLDRAAAGTLSQDDAIALEQMRYVDRMISLLKARARDELAAK